MQKKETPIDRARQSTGRVHRRLRVAGAELGLAHEALERQLPPRVKTGDVAWAIEQSVAVERKLEEAAEELQQVTGLLEEELAERERLEHRLARSEGAAGN